MQNGENYVILLLWNNLKFSVICFTKGITSNSPVILPVTSLPVTGITSNSQKVNYNRKPFSEWRTEMQWNLSGLPRGSDFTGEVTIMFLVFRIT